MAKLINTIKYVLNVKDDNQNSKNIRSLIICYIHNTGLQFGTSSCHVQWFAKIAMFCFVWTCVLQVIALVRAKNDPEKLFECFSILSFCGMGLIKLAILRIEHRRWYFLLDQITVLENEQLITPQNLSRDEYNSDDDATWNNSLSYVNGYTKKFRKTSTMLVKVYSSTAIIFILSPFVEYILKKIHKSDKIVAYPHILPGWRPMDSICFGGYLVAVLFEVVSAVYCVSVHVAFDLTAVGLMIFACAQFSILRHYSERIGGRGKCCSVTKERDARAHFRIVKCHRIHVKLINLVQELNHLIKNILGIYFFVATLTLCSVAIRLKTEIIGIMQLVNLLQYMCATLTQLFLFCSYGDAVYNESSIKTCEGPFGAAIWCLSLKVRRELMTLSIGMLRSHRLHAGPFNSLDLPSFIQIVRAAYSYYAVLGKK